MGVPCQMHKLIFGTEVINYSITYSLKARQKRVAISPNGIVVILPHGSTEKEGKALIESVKKRVYLARERMLRQERTRRRLMDRDYLSEGKVPFLGKEIQISMSPEKRKRTRLEYDGSLIIRIQDTLAQKDVRQEVQRKVERWTKEQLAKAASETVRAFGKKLGILPKGIRIKSQKKLWGSCGRNHIINLNWKLALFPREVFEYVVAHEMSHLRHMDHSKAFWKSVASLQPDYKKYREWLKFRTGGGLS
jgi:predicted metal-dependent hydrolase